MCTPVWILEQCCIGCVMRCINFGGMKASAWNASKMYRKTYKFPTAFLWKTEQTQSTMKTPEEFPPLIASISQKVLNWAHLDRSGIRGECSRAQVASQQRVEWRAEWRACCPPVSLQVLGQVFTRILQLVLIQDDVKHLLRWSRQRRLRLPFPFFYFSVSINCFLCGRHSQTDTEPVSLLPPAARSSICSEIFLSIWSAAATPAGRRGGNLSQNLAATNN